MSAKSTGVSLSSASRRATPPLLTIPAICATLSTVPEPGSRRMVPPAGAAARRRTPSEREARPAAARGGGVGVVDLERLADQVVDEIDLGAAEVFERDGVDQHPRPCALDHQVIGLGGRHQVELVLEAGASPALHADP